MKNNISILILSLMILSCSQESKESVLPEMNAYSEDQNYVLERFQWLGFDPSLVNSQPLKDGLGVIFGYRQSASDTPAHCGTISEFGSFC